MVAVTKKAGQLTRESIAYSMPAIGGLFPPPPIEYRDVESISVAYETDIEAASQVVPTLLELEEPCIAVLNVIRIGRSSIGTYNECSLTLPVTYQGEPRRYNVLMFVTSDMALTLGREALGAPKKLGDVHIEACHEGFKGHVERPTGMRLVSLLVTPQTLMAPDPKAINISPSVSLRIMPNPEGHPTPVAMELVETAADWRIEEQWEGPASLSFDSASDIDPWHRVPIKRIVRGYYTRMNVTQPMPRLMATL